MRIFALVCTFAISASVLFSGVTQADPAPTDPFDKCLKAVNSLGASMGHTDTTDDKGRPAFSFRLRTSGLDYTAVCDAQSGLISDVSPRIAGDQSNAL